MTEVERLQRAKRRLSRLADAHAMEVNRLRQIAATMGWKI
jgi:hypothetical protein